MNSLAIIIAFALAAGTTRYLCGATARLRILDHPNERSLHTQPTPRTGGIAVLAGLVGGGLLLYLTLPANTPLGILLVAGTPLIMVSFFDDRRGLHPALRILGHLLAASVLLWAGYAPETFALPGFAWTPSSPVAIAILMIFIVWLINLYNFMDGMDGFAGGMSVMGFGTFAILGFLGGNPSFASASLLVSAATAGFLIFNFPPAKIFLGDTGSSALGFLVAAFTLWGSQQGIFPIWVGVLVFAPFIVDATVTLGHRLLRGEKIWQPHKTHYYQRLVQMGWGHRRTVLAEYALMLFCSGCAVIAMRVSVTAQTGIGLLCLVVFTFLALTIDHIERHGSEWAVGIKVLGFRLRNRTAAMIHDLVMVPIAWFGAYWLRFNLESIPEPFLERALALFPLIIVVHAAMFIHFGLYRGVWRFASMPDFIRILKAVIAAAIVFSVLVFLITGMEQVPRSVFVLHGLLLFLLLGFPRFFYRWVKDHRLYYSPGARVLIVGAGRAGELLARDLIGHPDGEYRPVAFVDDDSRKKGNEVQGIRVVGKCKRIPTVVNDYQIDLIFLAIPSASAEAMRRIVAYCEKSGKPFRTLPSLQTLLSGRVTLRELREVSIEDLLGRAPVSLDWKTIRQKLSGRTVLISGGGGSIGSELCRQVAGLQPAALIILERSEFNLYQIDMELREHFPCLTLHPHLGDVCDTTFVNRIMTRYRPDTILHAAAYKHVPLLEAHAREAVRNNLFGTITLADAAEGHGCKTFVLISTDKAVKPSNIMGASKQLAELYCQHLNQHSEVRYVTVRFGNVLGSAGSVVPLFRRQIETGGPITVTDPRVSRYFMTISEASQLILQASAVGDGGEIFVLDMGEPINIRYLAEQMILLSGKKPDEDIAIDYIGLRPGEKLHEELFHEAEDLMPTPYPKLFLAQYREVAWPQFFASVEALRHACETYDEQSVRAFLGKLLGDVQHGFWKPARPKMVHG